jgi:heme/copper-type cytochrome/quinol oxidase subunit 3
MALLVFTEVMMFAGFVSAFVIVRSAAPIGAWPPPDQPRLPVERTALNTLALLLSGLALWVAGRRFRRIGPDAARAGMIAALALGAAFVGLQGSEWVALLRHGMTLTSSQLGSFFYLIIGAHALHAVAAIVALSLALRRLVQGRLTESRLAAVQLFWYFVVLVWPILYWRVYL